MKVELSDVKVYVGQVGRAYVNVVHAQREYDAALKNVQDAEFIAQRAVYLIEQCENAIVEATTVQTDADKANTAINKAIESIEGTIETYKSQLETVVGEENKAAIKEKLNTVQAKLRSLKALKADVWENDTDFNLFNGGSVNSAEENLKLLTNEADNSGALQIAQQVKVDALNLKDKNAEYAVKCKAAIDAAQEEFESWLTDDDDATQNDISDALELKYNRLLDKVEQILRDAEEINEAINGTTEYINNKISDIIDGVDYKQYAKFKLDESELDELVDQLRELSPENGEEVANYISDLLFNKENKDEDGNDRFIDIDENVYRFEFIQYPSGINSVGLKWTFDTAVPGDNVVTNTRTIMDILHPYADGIFIQGFAEDANLRLTVDAIALIKSVLYALNATKDDENPEYYSILTERPRENSQEDLDSMKVTIIDNVDGQEVEKEIRVLDAIEDLLNGNNVDLNLNAIRTYISNAMGDNLPDNFVIDVNDHETCKSVSLFLVRNIVTPNNEILYDRASLVEIFSIYKNGIYVLPYSGNANVQVSETVSNTIDLFLVAIKAIPSITKGVYNIISTKAPETPSSNPQDININPGSTFMP